jgi:hypothetical protein
MSNLLLLKVGGPVVGGGGGGGPFTTLNPADKHADITLSNGDLTAISGTVTSWRSVRSVVAMDASVDKIHVEVTIDNLTGSNQGLMVGIADAGAAILANYLGSVDDSLGYHTNFDWWGGQTGGTGTGPLIAGDVIIVEIDGPNRQMKVAKNTGSYGTPATLSGTNLDDDNNWFFALSIFTTNVQATVNFGDSAWVKTPTSGFVGLS